MRLVIIGFVAAATSGILAIHFMLESCDVSRLPCLSCIACWPRSRSSSSCSPHGA